MPQIMRRDLLDPGSSCGRGEPTAGRLGPGKLLAVLPGNTKWPGPLPRHGGLSDSCSLNSFSALASDSSSVSGSRVRRPVSRTGQSTGAAMMPAESSVLMTQA
jgi:hypothetical protein